MYLGDGARLPYGPRPLEEIRRFAAEIAGYLEGLGVKLIVAACNSATAAALPDLQRRLSVPVVGVLAPEAHAAVLATRNRRIGLLATEATVASGRYVELVHALDAGAEVVPVACPRLVPLIEGEDPFGEETAEAVREYAAPLQGGRGRHRDPRLHALPAHPPGLPARVRARRDARLLGRGDRARGRRAPRAPRHRERRGARGRVPVPHDRRPGALPRDGAPLPPAPDRRGRARRDRRARRRPRHEGATAAGATSFARSTSARTSSSSRTARSSTGRGRRSSSARRRSRRASRAGSRARAAAG